MLEMKNFHILKYGPIIGLPHFNQQICQISVLIGL